MKNGICGGSKQFLTISEIALARHSITWLGYFQQIEHWTKSESIWPKICQTRRWRQEHKFWLTETCWLTRWNVRFVNRLHCRCSQLKSFVLRYTAMIFSSDVSRKGRDQFQRWFSYVLMNFLDSWNKTDERCVTIWGSCRRSKTPPCEISVRSLFYYVSECKFGESKKIVQEQEKSTVGGFPNFVDIDTDLLSLRQLSLSREPEHAPTVSVTVMKGCLEGTSFTHYRRKKQNNMFAFPSCISTSLNRNKDSGFNTFRKWSLDHDQVIFQGADFLHSLSIDTTRSRQDNHDWEPALYSDISCSWERLRWWADTNT